MSEATETKQIKTVASELDEPRWSVVSFERCEASGLVYREAVALLSEKESAGVNGLCIITDEAAGRVNTDEFQEAGASRPSGLANTINIRPPG